ncbi:DUF349 domain-containing protein [Pseudoalteromonas aurantia]|uniref:DUF349 domain-containing protein n=1 Tax=Pseudoalteromonas aurantia 208 TaxID=1314867 RepID=A0ABR9E9T4_9GAMM|nr:DUF349 domain-containing protein [Pseudoalteromonas aurantia]MBE0367567.1 hypothetical protein [Pseudoalteromonas aurantia 208]
MIFKHLFTPKWKHPKTEIRLAAIDKLDTGKDANLLQTIALEDSSAEIRKKALHKVNDLVLWWQAYKQDQNLKDLAEQQISSAVLNSNSALSNDIRSEYIDRYAPAKFLEKLAFAEKELQVRFKLLKRLANAKLIEKAFREGSEELQVVLLPLIEQYQLEKSILKVAQGAALIHLQDYLEQQRLAKVMPKQVEQQTKMVLAKLNALRDKTSYQLVDETSKALFSEWQSIELKWLSEEDISIVDDKFKRISEKLNHHISALKTQYDDEQTALLAKQHKAMALAELTADIDAFDITLTNALQALDTEQSVQLSAKVLELTASVATSEYQSDVAFIAQFNRIESLQKELARLPELVIANSEMQDALTALAAITATDNLAELDTKLVAQKAAYDVCKKALQPLPHSLRQVASEKLRTISTEFKAAMEPLVNRQEVHLKQARRKGKDVQRLLDQGRFNVAFGVFNGFLESYAELTERNQQSIEKVHTALSTALADARDWQKYAATPKRAELLLALDEKLKETDVDAKKRAAEVKLLRTRWNELGRIDTDEEKAQAAVFDEKIELLFAPCRAHFAEQELQRKAAKTERTQIIEQMSVLTNAPTQTSDFDWRHFESQFNRLAKAWRSAGSVDGAAYKALNEQYRDAHNCVNGMLKSFHQANAAAKQKLVTRAQELVSSDELATACDELKSLQKQWQTLGFAGAKQEHTLWQTFRQHNDTVFSLRSEQFNAQKQQQVEVEKTQKAELAQISDTLVDSMSVGELQAVKEQVETFDALPSVRKMKASLAKKVDSILSQKQIQRDKEKFVSLLSALEQGTEIPSQWSSTHKHILSAEQLLLRLEILSNIDSPTEQKSQRMREQVALLDDKLQGNLESFEQYLTAYVNGAVETLNVERLASVLKAD